VRLCRRGGRGDFGCRYRCRSIRTGLRRASTGLTTTYATPFAAATSGATIGTCTFTHWKKQNKMNRALLVIDPQVDFCEGGSLAVPGATANMRRIARLLPYMDMCFLTMDSHNQRHIANAGMWSDRDTGKPVDDFSVVQMTRKCGKGHGIFECNGNEVYCQLDHPFEYLEPKYDKQTLASIFDTIEVDEDEHNQANSLMLWPDHCLIGTPGHNIHPDLMNAILKLNTPYSVYQKGDDLFTESFSALEKATTDPINTDLMEALNTFDEIYIVGLASSHCVRKTMKSILKGRTVFGRTIHFASKCRLVEDCVSRVRHPDSSVDDYLQHLHDACKALFRGRVTTTYETLMHLDPLKANEHVLLDDSKTWLRGDIPTCQALHVEQGFIYDRHFRNLFYEPWMEAGRGGEWPRIQWVTIVRDQVEHGEKGNTMKALPNTSIVQTSKWYFTVYTVRVKGRMVEGVAYTEETIVTPKGGGEKKVVGTVLLPDGTQEEGEAIHGLTRLVAFTPYTHVLYFPSSARLLATRYVQKAREQLRYAEWTHQDVLTSKWGEYVWNRVSSKPRLFNSTTWGGASPNQNPYLMNDGLRLDIAYRGRGELGNYGPNHAADLLCYTHDEDTGVVKVYLIKRKENSRSITPFGTEYATPGGMRNPEESAYETAMREFAEEVLDVQEGADELGLQATQRLRSLPWQYIYCGYSADRRNTMDAWIETTCVAVKLDSETKIKRAGGNKEIESAGWVDVSCFEDKEIQRWVLFNYGEGVQRSKRPQDLLFAGHVLFIRNLLYHVIGMTEEDDVMDPR
jgi:nicotinamidase/pyrazinamidase